jgi:hypothetical protein
LSIFGEILSRAHGNFEKQNGILESCIIINYHCILELYIITAVKLITGRENKIDESILTTHVSATNNFSSLLVSINNRSLAASFGSEDNHTHSN